MIAGASDIGFCSAIPGLNQIIAVWPLLRAAINTLETAGQLENLSGVRAIHALGVLDNVEWQAYARIISATAEAVVTPMFSFLMKNGAYNAPALVKGQWREWATNAAGFLNTDGSFRIEACKDLSKWLGQVSPTKQASILSHATTHIKALQKSISDRFSSMWDRIDFLPCALLDDNNEAEWAQKLVSTVEALDATKHDQHRALVNFTTTHMPSIRKVLSAPPCLPPPEPPPLTSTLP